MEFKLKQGAGQKILDQLVNLRFDQIDPIFQLLNKDVLSQEELNTLISLLKPLPFGLVGNILYSINDYVEEYKKQDKEDKKEDVQMS